MDQETTSIVYKKYILASIINISYSKRTDNSTPKQSRNQ